MKNYVIVGNGIAAARCIEGIRSADTKGKITVVSEEKHDVYCRPLISYYLEGRTDLEKMRYRDPDFYKKNGCTVLFGKKAVKIDKNKKQIELDDGKVLPYDKLCLATGSSPFIPPFEGLDTVKEKYSFMTLDDTLALEQAVNENSRVLIVGAGLIGLKCVLDNLKVIKENAQGALLLGKLFVDGFDEIPVIPVINDDVSVEEILSKNCVCGVSGDLVNRFGSDLYNLKESLASKISGISIGSGKITWDMLKTDQNGLIPVVCQDILTNEVLMVAYMNRDAYEKTIREGIMTYYSRSRRELWRKGDTSGHYQYVKELYCDCDKDTILAKVVQIGNACHTGSHSCFFNEILKKENDKCDPYSVLEDVMAVILDRKEHPKEGSYTNYLFDKGLDKILKKVGEEATEIVIAAKNTEPEECKYEIADLLYHIMVLMADKGLLWEDIMTELANR